MAGPFVVSRNGVVIGAPAQRVFDYVSDMARHSEWNLEPEFKVTGRPQEPFKVGSLFSRERTAGMQGPIILRGGMGDPQVTMVKITSIAAYQPYHELVFSTRNSFNGLLHSVETISFSFLQEPEGTRVSMEAQIEAMVPSAFIGPVYAIRVARASFERLLGRRLARIFPNVSVGPHLSRIKEMMETGKIAKRI